MKTFILVLLVMVGTTGSVNAYDSIYELRQQHRMEDIERKQKQMQRQHERDMRDMEYRQRQRQSEERSRQYYNNLRTPDYTVPYYRYN